METVHGLYGSEFAKCKSCGFCKHHNCYLTVKQSRQHNCLQKQCRHLIKNENHPYWKQREITKQRRKDRKQQINAYVNTFHGGMTV